MEEMLKIIERNESFMRTIIDTYHLDFDLDHFGKKRQTEEHYQESITSVYVVLEKEFRFRVIVTHKYIDQKGYEFVTSFKNQTIFSFLAKAVKKSSEEEIHKIREDFFTFCMMANQIKQLKSAIYVEEMLPDVKHAAKNEFLKAIPLG